MVWWKAVSVSLFLPLLTFFNYKPQLHLFSPQFDVVCIQRRFIPTPLFARKCFDMSGVSSPGIYIPQHLKLEFGKRDLVFGAEKAYECIKF